MHDLKNPDKKLVFASSRPMKCGDIIYSPPITKLKIKPAPTSSTNPASVPSIAATPRSPIIPPNQDQGSTTIVWNGGAEHPYAELWVQVDDAGEEFVVEKGSGTRRVSVERGKTYLYVLTDSGQRLATVTVKAN